MNSKKRPFPHDDHDDEQLLDPKKRKMSDSSTNTIQGPSIATNQNNTNLKVSNTKLNSTSSGFTKIGGGSTKISTTKMFGIEQQKDSFSYNYQKILDSKHSEPDTKTIIKEENIKEEVKKDVLSKKACLEPITGLQPYERFTYETKYPHCDYTIKSEINLSCYSGFSWLEDSESEKIKFQKSLRYYKFPSTPIPSELISTSQNNKLINEYLTSLRSEWLQSFESLFENVLAGKASSGYFFFKEFSILLFKSGFRNSIEPGMIVNGSNLNFRKLLQSSKIPFLMPFESAWSKNNTKHQEYHDKVDIDNQEILEIEQDKKVKRVTNLGSIDNLPYSLLSLHGRDSLLVMKDFILKLYKEESLIIGDFPTMVCESKFENSSVKSVNFKSSIASSISNNSLKKLHTLRIYGGYILPTSFLKICRLVQMNKSTFPVSLSCKLLDGSEWLGANAIIKDTSSSRSKDHLKDLDYDLDDDWQIGSGFSSIESVEIDRDFKSVSVVPVSFRLKK